MRLVLDTNVVASALLWGGPPRLLVQAGRDNRVELFTSTALLSVTGYREVRIVGVSRAMQIVGIV